MDNRHLYNMYCYIIEFPYDSTMQFPRVDFREVPLISYHMNEKKGRGVLNVSSIDTSMNAMLYSHRGLIYRNTFMLAAKLSIPTRYQDE